MIEFTPWPEPFAARYRQKGYWIGRPLCAALEGHAMAHPDRVAVICGGRTITYGQLDSMANNLAARLSAHGLGQGDTALVQLPNIAEFYVVFLALMKIGVAPLNALFSHKRVELTAYADQIRPKLLVADRSHALFGDDAFIEELSPVQALLLGENDPSRSLKEWLTDTDLQLTGGPTAPDQVAFFQLSGGSTGTPKLIPRTHNDYDYSIRESARICCVTNETRFLCALPAPHNFLLSSPGALGVFHAGGTVVMAANPDPRLCFDLIVRHRVNMAALVPSAVALWVEAAERRGAPASLAHLLVGGASFAPALAQRVPQALGCRLQQVFGMAEGLVNYTRLDDPDDVIVESQGRPISPDDEVMIIGEDGQPVSPGEVGQLAVRGPYTFRGYYRAPEQNARAFDSDGFYYSGDLVRWRADGNLQVVGRVKDQINRGGEKIAAEEVENLLMQHPAIAAVALVPVSDPTLGEKSVAFVVASSPLKGIDLRRHLISLGIADYKLPDRFRFIDALPLTHVGKPDKRKLAQTLDA
ncbi:(2,3-dihydroxybenzoyl)adenylate synthase [Paracoccus aurantiacus]|uniref:(2,3-dihydroxybenzoyl)adenylate synthase n=1 Tax=Paracoccus aurantiacus TaxID=2599412 RepID=A0A5C6RUK0_9RHOB|nr:(2,3-dihydroxybenzoyl)adenylate synthase [Paracoccus aurantiacus]TXB65684.1 (2,3-dihydroxybenzoyl)adenylate synthase [Paracoccus aurantiacus]